MTAAHTPGKWRLVIDDTGGPQSGWPLVIVSVDDEDKSIVRPGGQWPYEWDAAMSQREAVANARLIASAPDLLEALTLMQKAYAGPHIDNDEEWVCTVDDADAKCLAAIAKATGQ